MYKVKLRVYLVWCQKLTSEALRMDEQRAKARHTLKDGDPTSTGTIAWSFACARIQRVAQTPASLG